MKRILVVTASKHGSTAQIGQRLGDELGRSFRRRAVDVEVVIHDVAEVSDVGDFDAAVIGSAVYLGRWLKPARHLVESNSETLASMPVWAFSSGPVGDEAHAQVPSLPAWVREHRVFGGRLKRSELTGPERLVTKALHVADGDFRDDAEITAWAQRIAADVERCWRTPRND